MTASRPMTAFSCLTFDCYGTLVDWEGGIYKALLPLTRRLPASHPLHGNRSETLKAFTRLEGEVQRARPEALYSSVLADTYGLLAAEVGVEASEDEKAKFGAGVGDWPVFPDTLEALQRLRKHFKLVILSNVDRASFERTLARQLTGIDFDAIYTAQEIGSYKPDRRNFEYLIDRCEKDLGVGKDAILHTAQSLSHDHVPAKQVGLASAWIERGVEIESVMGGGLDEYRDRVDFSWRYRSMGEMADAVDADGS
ncbi:haloacid dehalogenase-like hydrolase [Hirsutella rhossiliensis]|uniref:Haloacid dehalogenase-like hydrolase domain-containing protein n=1 Tax=Hirsutella rhossiliensis TaxID=111463 RepID=A0A9P8SJW2_9HYPO|nr:haloacid dehalogenase-like hydrolase domain-containing protein [Hirsutella rhossiliensis]KAH0963471.1 haloacid dehalogenase-like hydrolase domain-containing protein [Hirsutella rhossiliensis]